MSKKGSAARGMFSSKSNPKPKPNMVPKGLGAQPGPEGAKFSKMAMEAYNQKESHRGMGV